MVRGFVHESPIYDSKGNWVTEVSDGDILLCSGCGFGSEHLELYALYQLFDDGGVMKLKGPKGATFDVGGTMPFFVKCIPERMIEKTWAGFCFPDHIVLDDAVRPKKRHATK